MIDKLQLIKERFDDVAEKLTDPNVINDMRQYAQLSRDYKELQRIVEAFDKYKLLISNIDNNRQIMQNEKDEDFRQLAKAELEALTDDKDNLEAEIQNLLIPKDPTDSKNAIMEIRAGTGGDEASLFAGDLYRMYSRYCERRGWKIEIISENPGTMGGYKEIIINVSGGENIYGQLKYESGVHRVQRVPSTEAQGRVHTSAASIAVLPEAEEFDVEIKDSDLRKDTFCAGGPGGQGVNTTYSAVRVVHLPTGIMVQCQDGRSQIKNMEKAMKVLRSRIYEMKYQEYLDDITKKRKTMVSTGDRSAKIRTYNFPQGRVTDHRIGLTIHNLPFVLDGNIQELLDGLQLAENAEKMKEGSIAA